MGTLLNEPDQDFGYHEGEKIAFFVQKTEDDQIICFSDMTPSRKLKAEDLEDGSLLKEAVSIFNIEGFSANVQDIIKSLDFDKQIDKMDKNNRLLSVVKAFSELDLDSKTIDNVKMGYIFEDLIRRFSENAEAGDHYTGRDIIKLMVNILLAEGCDDIFDDHKEITILDQAAGTGGMLSTSYNFIHRYNYIC